MATLLSQCHLPRLILHQLLQVLLPDPLCSRVVLRTRSCLLVSLACLCRLRVALLAAQPSLLLPLRFCRLRLLRSPLKSPLMCLLRSPTSCPLINPLRSLANCPLASLIRSPLQQAVIRKMLQSLQLLAVMQRPLVQTRHQQLWLQNNSLVIRQVWQRQLSLPMQVQVHCKTPLLRRMLPQLLR